MRKEIIAVTIFCLFVILISQVEAYIEVECPGEAAGDPRESCQRAINSIADGGTIFIRFPFTFEDQNSLVFSNKRNIIFDCNGTTINCSGSSECIIVIDSFNITIRNCTFLNFSNTGIYVERSGNVSILNSGLFLGEFIFIAIGIRVEGSNNTIIRSTNLSMNSSCDSCEGIYIGGWSNNTLLTDVDIGRAEGSVRPLFADGIHIMNESSFTVINNTRVCVNNLEEDFYDIHVEARAQTVSCSDVVCNKTTYPNCCSSFCGIQIDECRNYRWYTIGIVHNTCDYTRELCVTNQSPYGNYNKFVHYCKKVRNNYYLYNISVSKGPQEQRQEGIINKIINLIKKLF
ncbi:MAG: right-handed parallel beta-helix repeat-containing protein [Candidatus Pacearchaeota archaeon]